MTKKIVHIIIFLIVAGIVTAAFVGGDPDDDVRSVGLLPALLLATLYLGALFTLYILPELTYKATNAVLGSNEVIDDDPLRDARAAIARGEYEQAIEVYRSVVDDNPLDRFPWVEIINIQHDQLDDPEAAIDTLNTALESQDWPADDTAFFMGRLASIQLEDMDNPEASAEILEQIIEMFPETQYSASATHKLREMEHL